MTDNNGNGKSNLDKRIPLRDIILYAVIVLVGGAKILGINLPSLNSDVKADIITKDELRQDQALQTSNFEKTMLQIKDEIRKERQEDFKEFKKDFFRTYRKYGSKTKIPDEDLFGENK